MGKYLFIKLFNLPRTLKTTIQILVDCLLIIFFFFLSLIIRLNEFTALFDINYWILGALLSIITILIFYFGGFYTSIVRYINEKFLLISTLSVLTSSLLIYILSLCLDIFVPRSIPFIYFHFTLIFTLGGRYLIKYIFLSYNFDKRKLVAIYGAGKSGRELMKALEENENYQPFIFIDDDENLNKKKISGLKVLNLIEGVSLLKKFSVDLVLLAMPNISYQKQNLIIDKLDKYRFSVKKIPSINKVISDKLGVIQFSDITTADILDREESNAIYSLTKKNIKGKVVLVTGAGGSIGTELCKNILINAPKLLICLDNSEYSLYKINEVIKTILNENNSKVKVLSILGSVQDKSFLNNLFDKFDIQTIYHTAAYKHVPLVEDNVIEAIKNNVFATFLLAQIAIIKKVKTFILISSDKAVRPTNYMGVTKRLSEIICQNNSKQQNNTIFTIVRFGNVIGSSGSVIPLFEKQIKTGGPVTITHKDVTRYFMTIKEAAQLIIQAGALSKNGDLFILDMKEPIKIYDIAKKLVRLFGKKPVIKKSDSDIIDQSKEIEIKITGLRPGEKTFEELLINNKRIKTKHPRIFKAREKMMSSIELNNLLKDLEKFCLIDDLPSIEHILKKADLDFNSKI